MHSLCLCMLREANQTESTQVLVSFNDWYRSVWPHRSGCPFCLQRSPTEEPNVQRRKKKKERREIACAAGESLRMVNILENRVLKFLEPTKIISNPSNSCAYARFQYFGIGGCQCKTSVLELSRVGLNGRSYQMQEDPMSLRSASWSDFKGLDVLLRPTCFEFNLFTLCPLAANCHFCHKERTR